MGQRSSGPRRLRTTKSVTRWIFRCLKLHYDGYCETVYELTRQIPLCGTGPLSHSPSPAGKIMIKLTAIIEGDQAMATADIGHGARKSASDRTPPLRNGDRLP